MRGALTVAQCRFEGAQDVSTDFPVHRAYNYESGLHQHPGCCSSLTMVQPEAQGHQYVVASATRVLARLIVYSGSTSEANEP